MTGIIVFAPFAAWCGPLGEVPDEAFAQGMLGEGIALDPLEGTLRAPFAGDVSAIAGTGHAVTIRHESGAEVLVHVGIDTIRLGGRGFTCLTRAGAHVAAGEELLKFDLDLLAREARSLMSPLVLLGDGFRLAACAQGRAVQSGEPVATLIPLAGIRAGAAEPCADRAIEGLAVLALANGLHARPAARIAAALRPLDAEVELRLEARSANARSITALLKLDARRGDGVRIAARGRDADAAMAAVRALLESEEEKAIEGNRPMPVPNAVAGALAGVRAAPGGALGAAFLLATRDLEVPPSAGPAKQERDAIHGAIAALATRLQQLSRESEIAGAHLAILTDPDMQRAAEEHIAAGESAAVAWRAV